MSAYARGAQFERAVRARLQEKGFLVVRSAGSKTPIDLVAIPLAGGPNVFVQCKSGKTPMTRAEVRAFAEFCRDHHAIPLLVDRPPGKTRGQRWRFLNDELEQAA